MSVLGSFDTNFSCAVHTEIHSAKVWVSGFEFQVSSLLDLPLPSAVEKVFSVQWQLAVLSLTLIL